MNNLHTYHKMLRQLRQWLPAERITRLRNMALLIVGLTASGAIHLSRIAETWPVPGKSPSLTNRLRRFLDNHRVDVASWYRPVAEQLLARFSHSELVLIVDVTKVGFKSRMLMIGVAFKRRTLPLAWRLHRGPKGHVALPAQLALFQEVAALIPAGQPVWVLADAGFESVKLLQWIQRQGWSFVSRQNGRTQIRQPGEKWTKLSQMAIQEGETRVIGRVRLTERYDAGWFYLVIHWASGEEDPWYLVSNRPEGRRLIRRYKKRMWIEEMYGDMKGHGFDLEATHLDDLDRISRLVLGVSIAYVWLIALGSWLVKRGWRHLIDHKSRRDKSYLRLGWDWVRRCSRLEKPVPIRFSLCF